MFLDEDAGPLYPPQVRDVGTQLWAGGGLVGSPFRNLQASPLAN